MYLFVKNDNFYTFFTDFTIVYEVAFVKTYYFEDFPIMGNHVFEIVIESMPKSTSSIDPKIGPTIANIINHFLDTPDKIIVFNCDVSDRKEKARNRKFDQWFRQFSHNLYTKLDSQFYDEDSQLTYFSSLIMRNDNLNAYAINEAFYELFGRLNNK
jgi:hypothetical protein